MHLKTEQTYLSKYFCDKPKFNQTHNPSVRTIKNQVRAMETTKTSGMPQDMEDLKKIKRRHLALEFMEGYTKGTIKSKAKFIKANRISIQTLNRALSEMGMEVMHRTDNGELSEVVNNDTEVNKEQVKTIKSMPKTKRVSKRIDTSPTPIRKGGNIVGNEITLNDIEEYGLILNNTEKHNIVKH